MFNSDKKRRTSSNRVTLKDTDSCIVVHEEGNEVVLTGTIRAYDLDSVVPRSALLTAAIVVYANSKARQDDLINWLIHNSDASFPSRTRQ